MGGEHVGQIGLTVSGKRSKELFTVKIKGSSPGAGYAWDSEEQSAQAEAPSSIRSSFTLTSRGSVPLVIHDITANTGELTTTCPLNKEIPKGSSCAVNIFLAASAFAADTGFVRGKLAINMKTNASSTVEKPAILNWFFSLVAIRDVEVLRKN
jgi:hypothetical protein